MASDTPPGGTLVESNADDSSVPIHVVNHASQLPTEFLNPSAEKKLVIGFDCEGIDLCRHGSLCIIQIAYSLIEEQEGRKRAPDDYISFVGLLADPRYCGVSYAEKEEVRVLLRQDPKFWTYRPMSEMMVLAAAADFVDPSTADVFASAITNMQIGHLPLLSQVFIIGPVKQVRKAEAIIRGRMLDI